MNSDVEQGVQERLKDLTRAWGRAELAADTAALDRLLAADFVGVGPLGFMLSKSEWLARHRGGDLKYTSFEVDDLTVRVYGDAAVVIGRQTQQATYQGHPVPGQLRVTLIWVKPQTGWALAGLHLSPIADRPA